MNKYDNHPLTSSTYLQVQKCFVFLQIQKRGWTGLLVEPNFILFTALKQKNRKVFIAFIRISN
jgi:hypothetical protein